MANIEQTRKSANLSKIELVETELAARERKYEAVRGDGFGELGIVAAAGACTVAATDQEEVADCVTLHRVDHLAGNAQNSIVSEPNCNLLVGTVFRVARRLESSSDH